MNLLTCREYGNLTVGDGQDKDLTKKEADRLCALADRARKRLQKPPVLTRTYSRGKGQVVKAAQVVGTLAIPGKTLEILPKIDGDDEAVRKSLIHMLAVAHDLRMADGELAALDTQHRDLLEIFIGLFANRLLDAVRRGLPRRYIEHGEDLKLLRGRLNVTRQVTHLAVRADLLACRFDELSEDTPLNRVFKAAVRRLARITRTAANARLMAELTARFEFVSDTPNPLREPVRLDRTNTAFQDLYRLAKLFLAGDWQSTTSGEATGFTLLFPMNELFENFIGKSLKRALGSGRVRLQDGRHSALTDEAGRSLFNLQPDAVIEPSAGANSHPIILDTKWKKLEPHKPRHERTLGVPGSDVYQMLAYARAYRAERIILLYPRHEALDGYEKPDKGGILRTWKVAEPSTTASSRPPACHLNVAVVDVGKLSSKPREVVDALRCLINGSQPSRQAA